MLYLQTCNIGIHCLKKITLEVVVLIVGCIVHDKTVRKPHAEVPCIILDSNPQHFTCFVFSSRGTGLPEKRRWQIFYRNKLSLPQGRSNLVPVDKRCLTVRIGR